MLVAKGDFIEIASEMKIRHAVLRNKMKNDWQANSSLLQWYCICEHCSSSFPFASPSFASSPRVTQLIINFLGNGQTCQMENTTLRECNIQHRNEKVVQVSFSPPPCETSWQWEHLEGSVQRAQRAKTSCPADVTPRNSRFVTHFQKMKWDWQIHHERAPRPRGTALRYCCSPFAGATVGQLETRRWRCASPKRFLPYFSSERGQQGQNGPMGRPNITIKVPPCFLG